MPATPTEVSSLPDISATPDTVSSQDTPAWSPDTVSSPATVSTTVWPSPPNKYKTLFFQPWSRGSKTPTAPAKATAVSPTSCPPVLFRVLNFPPPERLLGLATGPSSYVLGETRQTPHHFIWRHAIF